MGQSGMSVFGFTITGTRFATKRGLRVGDSSTRVTTLYGSPARTYEVYDRPSRQGWVFDHPDEQKVIVVFIEAGKVVSLELTNSD
jgi:hypothetical protein